MAKDILSEVNKVYSEKTPSKYFDDEVWLPKFIENAKDFLLKLKIPPRAFLNSTLVDFGCGTGQKSLVYDQLGASCTLIEYDKKSIEMAKNYFNKYASNPYKFIHSSLFDANIEKSAYDFVLSSGVAHHTSDPVKNLELCCDALKPGGMLIFGIANKSGFFQRHLQRLIIYSISESKEDIVKFSKILFKESLERSVKYGGRTIDAIIWDTFLNPKIYAFGTQEIINCFNSKNLELYSSYRDLKIAQTTLQPSDNYHKNMSDPNINARLDSEITPIYISDFEDLTKSNNLNINNRALDQFHQLLPYFNAITDEINDLSFDNYKINVDDFLSNVRSYQSVLRDFEKIHIIDIPHNDQFMEEVCLILDILKNNKAKLEKLSEIKAVIENSKHLFRMFNGVGMNYYCGYKGLE